MICDIAGAGGVLHVDARVEVPDIEHVPVLRASQGGIDVETVQDALGLNADTAEVAEGQYRELCVHGGTMLGIS